MPTKLFRSSIVALLMGLGVLVSGSPADAAFRLRVESGTLTGPGVVLTDGGAGDGTPASDALSYSGAIGQFVLSFTVGTKTPIVVAPSYFEVMDLTNVTINSGGVGTLRLILESDDFGASTPDGLITLQNEIGGTLSAPLGSTITSTVYLTDLDGEMPDLGLDVAPEGVIAAIPGSGPGSIGYQATSISHSFAPPPGAFSGTIGASLTKSGRYSMYNVIEVSFTGAGTVSFDSMTGTVPEPATLGIWSLFAVGSLGFCNWRHKRKSS